MTALIIVAAILMGIIGIIGAIAPGLPGTPLSFIGMLLLLLLPDFEANVAFLIVMAVIALS